MAKIQKSLKYEVERNDGRGYIHRNHKPHKRNYHEKRKLEEVFRLNRRTLLEEKSLEELKICCLKNHI